MMRLITALALCLALPAVAESNRPDPHTRAMGMFETACLRGAEDFSDSDQGFFVSGLEQKAEGYWVDPFSEIIGATRSSEGDVQRLCSVGLVQGDPMQFAEILPGILASVWEGAEMKRFAGSGDRSDIFMTENETGVRAAWVDVSEGNIAVLMTSFTRKEDNVQ